VQGPVVTEAALQLGVPVQKVIMALAYGDGLTNMLQPFWALPLLGITKLEAKDIAAYCAYIFLAGFILYSVGIWLFL
jgi:short-chain fatty acids transporter